MDGFEIELARAYLAASGHDPISALIRSVKDLASLRRAASEGTGREPCAPRGENSRAETRASLAEAA